MMYTYKTNQEGFSLVETLVAITILLIIIVGPMSIATNASRSTSFANEQVIAYFLAQEGLEIAQKTRDDILLPEFIPPLSTPNNDAWDEFAAPIASEDLYPCYNGGCGLTVTSNNVGSTFVQDCSSNILNCRLFYNADTGIRARYTHVSGGNEQTDYIRIITMQETVTDQQVLVTSEVRWRTDGQIQEQRVTATTYLFNVYGR